MKLHSIRFKITAMAVAIVLATVCTIIAFSYSAIQQESEQRSVEIMSLVGKETKSTLDEYFVSIEQAVGMTANMAVDSLDSVMLVECGAAGSHSGARTPAQAAKLDAYIAEHCAQIQKNFESMASHTHGVVTYYYCINPAVSENEHGFFYSRVGKAGFVEQPPLDARELDPADSAHTTWYYTPIERGRPSWVGPYTAHFLNEMWICSYLVPIYGAGTLIGVLGMDISLQTMTEQVKPIRVYDSGFASLCDENGKIYWHPTIEAGLTPELSKLNVSRELLHERDSGDSLIRYTVNGEKRQMCFFTLRNGMKLVLTAPVKEINSSWLRLIRMVLFVTAAAIVIYGVVLMLLSDALARPLLRLTAASRRLADGDYDVALDYSSRDEVGVLTEAFSQMRDHLKFYIADLRRRATTDDLTGLPNMRSFFRLAGEARERLLENGRKPAMLYINLIGLKFFNRQYGFAEGDALICQIADILRRYFGENCVGRFGQDHFAAVTDEEWLDELLETVFKACGEANNGRSLPLRVGVYRHSMEPVEVSAACDRAKYACDRLRGSYVSDYRFFDQVMLKRVKTTLYVLHHFDQALAEGWVKVYYQPIIRSANSHVCDEECLSRWIDPEMGLLSPGDFIPILEEARLIYRLDLYVLDRALEKMQAQQRDGRTVVPHSINLSRVDFDACDIVEEVCRRVDAAGIARDKLSVEVTESCIGEDFEFMKTQIERFQAQGFRVWMDDFGSGYSSLDVLQDIHFDLLKFDMRFMHRFSENDESRIILTELIRMAISLGIDTVCEGVETAEQAEFLREAGCTKLQGYFFCRPIPEEALAERYRKGEQIGYENLAEAEYYEAIGRINLFDISAAAGDFGDSLGRYFSLLPMAVIEADGSSVSIARCNQSYRDFLKREFGTEKTEERIETRVFRHKAGAPFTQAVTACREPGAKTFIQDSLPGGLTLHAMLRHVAENPVSGVFACVVVVLGVSDAGGQGGTGGEKNE